MITRLLYLVRHGEQELAESAVEEPDTGLSERGRRQAILLGERLRGQRFSAIHHGPLLRAAQTAELVATSLPEVPVYETELAGDHLPHDTDTAGLPPAYATFLTRFSAAERTDGPRVTAAAVRRFAGPVGEGTAGDEPVRELVVTHTFLIGWLVRHALDAPERRWLGLNAQNAGLTIIRYSPAGPPNLLAVNDVGHLPPELRGTGMPPDYLW
ncbi:histidine phosphatase family protein [Micromonospora sp. WMMD1120]|uniref:histidine phosphatase family protein n=1 Tax=Micromonospora sp. WMMD1120 TaxID=3016106 RepID=UPI00241622B0|nr:histidine phosphatase family protein [Micromonospora sp. WMMD1120]MDG4806553.1 histidine phosphatase family protein [Micromonospora sp. WMMD1120]